MSDSPLKIRVLTARDVAYPGERTWLRAAAQTRGRALLAERNGLPIATISVTSGAIVTDAPNAVAWDLRMLRLARYRIIRQAGHRWPARALRWTPPQGNLTPEQPSNRR
jgi:hypothetical protein